MSRDKKKNPDLDYLKQLLLQDVASTQWIERKEIFAWTAMSLYLIGLTFVFNTFFDYAYPISWPTVVIVIVGLICLAYIAFIFIQSQFSVTYSSRAFQQSVKVTIYKIIRNEDIDLRFNHEVGHPYELANQIKEHQKKHQPLIGSIYPLQIVVSLFFNIPINQRRKRRAKRERPQLGPREKQEASIYALILLVNASLIYYLMLKKWSQYWWVSPVVIVGYFSIFVTALVLALKIEKKVAQEKLDQ